MLCLVQAVVISKSMNHELKAQEFFGSAFFEARLHPSEKGHLDVSRWLVVSSVSSRFQALPYLAHHETFQNS